MIFLSSPDPSPSNSNLCLMTSSVNLERFTICTVYYKNKFETIQLCCNVLIPLILYILYIQGPCATIKGCTKSALHRYLINPIKARQNDSIVNILSES